MVKNKTEKTVFSIIIMCIILGIAFFELGAKLGATIALHH